MDQKETAVQERPPLPEEVRVWQQQLVQGVLRVLVVLGPLAAAVGSYRAYTLHELWRIPLYWGAYAIVLLVAVWRRASYALKVGTLLSLLYGLGAFELLAAGVGGNGRLFLLCLPIVTGLFFGLPETLFASVVVLLTMIVAGWSFSSGFVSNYQEVSSSDAGGWLSNTLVLLLVGALPVAAYSYLVPRLVAALAQSQDRARELAHHQAQLEQQIDDRSDALTRRARHLEATAEVARDAALLLELEALLSRAATLISERFGFYHAGIFLLDSSGEWAELKAASSEGGRRMLLRGHRLRVGEEGIVGYATGRGVARTALDVGADAVFFDNADLPDTRSEVALPLRARGEIIGALDVQSRDPEAFTDEDVAVLQTLADQIALAISNARLLQQVQESLEAERRGYGELSLQAWVGLLRTHPELGERYDPQGILPGSDRWREEMKRAARTGETVVDNEKPSATMSTPIRVRDQVIGVLDAHKAEGADQWTLGEIALMETLAGQLGIALEGARLFQDAQARAAREQMLGQFTARIRETLDVETVLQTAVRHIGETLGMAEVEVRMGSGGALQGRDGYGTKAANGEVSTDLEERPNPPPVVREGSGDAGEGES